MRRSVCFAGSKDDEKRATDLLSDTFEREAVRYFLSLCIGSYMAPNAERLLRRCRHAGQHPTKIERSAIRNAGLQARFKCSGERSVEGAKTLPNDSDGPSVNILPLLEVIDDSAYHWAPLRANWHPKCRFP